MKLSLFDKIINTDKNQQFTVKARRLQVILILLNDNDAQYHKLRDMQNEIYSMYPDIYKFDYKPRKKDHSATPSEKAEKGYGTFNKYVREMEENEIIRSRVTPSIKNSIDIKEYQITEIGKLLTPIIEYMDSPNDNKIQNKLYSYWQSYFNNKPYSLDLFCINYFRRCKEAGLLKDFLEFFKTGITKNFHHFNNLNNLFTHTILLRTPDKQKNKVLLDLWLESYQSLDWKNRDLFTCHLKIYINRIIQPKVSDYACFEDERYSNSMFDDKIVIEVSCSSCHSCYYRSLSILLYITFLFHTDGRQLDSQISDLRCTKCNVDRIEILGI